MARTAAEEARRIRLFADAALEGLLVLDGERIVDANRSILSLAGHESFADAPKHLAALFPDLDLATLPRGADAVATECVFLDASGRRVDVEVLLRPREALLREFNLLEKRVRQMARTDARARLLATTPGVGPVVGLTFVAAIDDPARFKSSKTVGAHFGMTPRKYQSGETDITGRISKIGDAGVRAALFEAAHVLLTKPIKGCTNLKSWAMRLARRAGMRRAKVALARRLAVILHRMMVEGAAYNDQLLGKAAVKA